MKIILFDLWNGGHNHIYFMRFAEALAEHEVFIIAPTAVLARIPPLSVHRIDSGQHVREPIPFGQGAKHLTNSAMEEIQFIRQVGDEIKPDYFIHMFADHLLPHLEDELFSYSTSFLVLFASHHYPESYGVDLTENESRLGLALKQGIVRCRQWVSVQSLIVLDPFLAETLNQKSGCPVIWLPEPPITTVLPEATHNYADVAFFGAIAHRKGLSRLATSVACTHANIHLVVGGWVEQDGYQDQLNNDVQRMQQAGATVELRLTYHTEQDALALLGSVTCTVMPYHRHFGMSRVLLESCLVGTPIIVHNFGLLAHLVTHYGLGLSVDCDDPLAFADAIEHVTDRNHWLTYSYACQNFAKLFTSTQFSKSIYNALGLDSFTQNSCILNPKVMS